MAAAPSPPKPAAVIGAVAVFDIVLGIAMALFGEMVVPLGVLMSGFPLWWLIGGLLVLSGVGALAMSMVLARRGRPEGSTNDGPVSR
jgi:hypothetical protein